VWAHFRFRTTLPSSTAWPKFPYRTRVPLATGVHLADSVTSREALPLVVGPLGHISLPRIAATGVKRIRFPRKPHVLLTWCARYMVGWHRGIKLVLPSSAIATATPAGPSSALTIGNQAAGASFRAHCRPTFVEGLVGSPPRIDRASTANWSLRVSGRWQLLVVNPAPPSDRQVPGSATSTCTISGNSPFRMFATISSLCFCDPI
jgi:hypothetical protein